MTGLDRTPAWGPLLRAAAAGELPLVRVGLDHAAVAREVSGQVYLATPYSLMAQGPDGWDIGRSKEMRDRAAWHQARFATLGVTAVSPIAQAAQMCHLSHALDPLDAVFWTRWCAPMLAASRAVVVPDINGWRSSLGIWHEVRAAIDAVKPVYLMEGAG